MKKLFLLFLTVTSLCPIGMQAMQPRTAIACATLTAAALGARHVYEKSIFDAEHSHLASQLSFSHQKWEGKIARNHYVPLPQKNKADREQRLITQKDAEMAPIWKQMSQLEATHNKQILQNVGIFSAVCASLMALTPWGRSAWDRTKSAHVLKASAQLVAKNPKLQPSLHKAQYLLAPTRTQYLPLPNKIQYLPLPNQTKYLPLAAKNKRKK